MNILEKIERIPPFLCRYLARTSNGRRGLTHNQIAQRSKLSRSVVRQLSFATTWRGHAVETCCAFALACGVNHLAAEKQLDFLKRRKLTHVARATNAQKQMYDRLEGMIVEQAKKRNPGKQV